MTAAWMDRAACIGHPTEWWVPDTKRLERRADYIAAGQAICAECPVRVECAGLALDGHTKSGVAAGVDLGSGMPNGGRQYQAARNELKRIAGRAA